MPSQEEPAPEIYLDADEDEFGKLHSRPTKTGIQKDDLLNFRSRSGFVARANLATVVHGHCGPDKTPATLIVFDFQFHSPPQLTSRKFEYAHIEFTFTAYPAGEPADDPYIKSFAPVGPTTLNANVIEVATERNVNIQPNVTAAGVTAELGSYSQKETITRKKSYSTQISGVPLSSGGPGRYGPNQVIWDAAQNPDLKDGIPPRFSTAILLEREEGKFCCSYEIKSTVDFREGRENVLGRLFGRTKPNDPIIFDPKLPPQGMPTAIDKEKLDKLEEYYSEKKIEELVEIQIAKAWGTKEAQKSLGSAVDK